MAIELLKQLVGLVDSPHGLHRATGIGVVAECHLPIGLADVRQGDPLTELGWQLQQTQGALESHRVLQGLE